MEKQLLKHQNMSIPIKRYIKNKKYLSGKRITIAMKKKAGDAGDFTELVDILDPGECVDVELTDGDGEPIIKAHICKTKAKD